MFTVFEEKFFVYYLDLPPELRTMIIDRMQTEDRCRFTRCSKLCNKEVKASNNHIYSLQFFADENVINITTTYNKRTKFDVIDFSLKFTKKNGKTFTRYVVEKDEKLQREDTIRFLKFGIPPKEKELWREELHSSTDLVEYAAEYFKKQMKVYQNKIKHLVFHGNLFTTKLKDYDFGIESLSNLEKLEINGHMDVLLYLSKLRRPLREIYVEGRVNNRKLAASEQVSRIKNRILMTETKFTNEQFLRLSAPFIQLDIGYLTEVDVFNFIRSWQNDTIGKEVMFYEWNNLGYSKFDVFQLFNLFGKELSHEVERESVVIRHYKRPLIAELTYYDRSEIIFAVQKDFEHV